VVNAALAGKDTLALLPTGGGKSICFQVPALMLEGLTLVISPLIALMEDQVMNLRQKEISAVALNSSMSFREIDNALENAANGHYKLVYLSPERLKTELFLERLKRMKVSLIAVDEAHCISQWGYDFRPAYLEIAALREALPQVPVLALTATATPRVVQDIQEKLAFTDKHVIQQSFKRKNLIYSLINTEAKWDKALRALQKTNGGSIIYMRNRRATVEISEWLQGHGFTATFYHAGLSSAERQKRQKAWLSGACPIMVCTNAFGMGIDKPNVRLVIHLDLPDSLEAYFQEAGRAGRDGSLAHSLLILGPADRKVLVQKHLETFPDLDFVRRVYQAIANYFQIAEGAGMYQSFSFPVKDFTQQYRLPNLKTYQTLKILEREGLIELGEALHQPSRVKVLVSNTQLYDFQLKNENYNLLIKTLVRSYGGLQVEYALIDESLLAQRLGILSSEVKKKLSYLQQNGLIDYQPSKGSSTLTFTETRKKASELRISPENLDQRYQDLRRRIEAVLSYSENNLQCRSLQLLKYFGETNTEICGACDVCRRLEKKGFTATEVQLVYSKLCSALKDEPVSLKSFLTLFNASLPLEDILKILLQEEYIELDKGILKLKN
jgi:ATP-dependent DNA helicase RecQ